MPPAYLWSVVHGQIQCLFFLIGLTRAPIELLWRHCSYGLGAMGQGSMGLGGMWQEIMVQGAMWQSAALEAAVQGAVMLATTMHAFTNSCNTRSGRYPGNLVASITGETEPFWKLVLACSHNQLPLQFRKHAFLISQLYWLFFKLRPGLGNWHPAEQSSPPDDIAVAALALPACIAPVRHGPTDMRGRLRQWVL